MVKQTQPRFGRVGQSTIVSNRDDDGGMLRGAERPAIPRSSRTDALAVMRAPRPAEKSPGELVRYSRQLRSWMRRHVGSRGQFVRAPRTRQKGPRGELMTTNEVDPITIAAYFSRALL
jgi:hypothetical protein